MVALVVANLVPLAGVLFWGWDLATIVALYWLENGVVGVFALARIWTAEAYEPDPHTSVTINERTVPAAQLKNARVARAILGPFFVLHYGMFWLVHGVFVWFALPAIWGEMSDGVVRGPQLGTIAWAVPFLVVSHGLSFWFNWWLGGERHTSSPSREMSAPYGRVIVLHLTIVLGAFLVAALGAPIWALGLMVALKTIADLAAHLAERESASARADRRGVELQRQPALTIPQPPPPPAR